MCKNCLIDLLFIEIVLMISFQSKYTILDDLICDLLILSRRMGDREFVNDFTLCVHELSE